MTPAEALARVLESGGRIVESDRPQLAVPQELEPLVHAHKAGLRRALAYRQALRTLYGLTAEGEQADLAAVTAALAEHARWVDDLGPTDSEAVGRSAAREWFREHARCPWCGAAGQFHAEARP